MDDSPLTPRQQELLERVFSFGATRPKFDPEVAAEIRRTMEDALRDDAALIDAPPLRIGKSHLSRVHQCEGLYVAQRDAPWQQTVGLMRGTVAHRMIAEILGAGRSAPTLEHADAVVDRMAKDDDKPSQARFLRGLDTADMADIKMGATNAAIRFFADWPPPVRAWRMRVEAPIGTKLADGRLKLVGTPDLVFGVPHGNTAGVIMVDIKTGDHRASHLDDLRYYALLQTLRDGVPPYRVVSYYLEEGSVQCEDVSTATLETGARRAIDGIRKIIELSDRQPKLSPGWQCGWCPARDDCEPGNQFLAERQ